MSSSVCVLCVREREREYTFLLMFFFSVVFVANVDALMTGVEGFQCGFPTQIQMQCAFHGGLNKTKTRNSLALDGTLLSGMTVLYVGVLYPCHRASKCATNIYNRKKATEAEMCTLSVSVTHTHTHTHTPHTTHTHTPHTHSLTYMLTLSTVILLYVCMYVYSMYIEYCCSVGTFGAKFI